MSIQQDESKVKVKVSSFNEVNPEDAQKEIEVPEVTLEEGILKEILPNEKIEEIARKYGAMDVRQRKIT